MYKPQVVLTSRVADAALFLAPMIYELGWDWEDYDLLAAGALAGHLLECGCQLTGGYFASPGDGHRSLSIEDLLASSLPFADVTSSGSVVLGKADGSGGELSVATCTQQLIYEIGDPRAYITPDVVVDMRNVHFTQCRLDRVQVEGACAAADTPVPDTLLRLIPMDAGWKAWGEISYGGCDCEERAKISEAMVLAWMESGFPGSGSLILSYIIGRSSLWYPADNARCHPLTEARLRFDGLFPTREQADALCAEVEALYTNGPAGGGGIRTGVSSEIALQKSLVPKKDVHWVTSAMSSKLPADPGSSSAAKVASRAPPAAVNFASPSFQLPPPALPAKRGVELFLYQVAHGRAGDKGNRINISIIPFSPDDLSSLRSVLTPDWVQRVVSRLPSYLRPGLPLSRERAMESQKSYQASPLPASSQTPELRPAVSQVETSKKVQAQRRLSKPCQVEVYELVGVSALNIVVDDILDGGVTMSRHLDRHGKTLADLLLNEVVILP